MTPCGSRGCRYVTGQPTVLSACVNVASSCSAVWYGVVLPHNKERRLWDESRLDGDLEMPTSACEVAVVSTHVEDKPVNKRLCHAPP